MKTIRILLLPALFFLPSMMASPQDVLPIDPDEGVDSTKVNQAIDKGVEWLKKQQDAGGRIGTFMHNGDDYEKHYPGGTTALALLTLIKSGVPKDDPVIAKGFEYIKTKTTLLEPTEKDKTYCVAFLILALEAINDPEGKMDEKTSVKSKNLDKENKEWMKRLHAWLIDHRTEYESDKDAEGNPLVRPGSKKSTGSFTAQCVCWGYPTPKPSTEAPGTRPGRAAPQPPAEPAGPVYDDSNTQIAVLALKACARVGIKTPDDIWKGILFHFLRLQESDGPAVKRVGLDDAGKTTDVETDDKCRGFPYRGKSDFPTGPFSHQAPTLTMTCAGLGSLLICRSELLDSGDYRNRLAPLVDAAVRDSLAWLGVVFPQLMHKKPHMDILKKDPDAKNDPPKPANNRGNNRGGNDPQPAGGLNYYAYYSIERVATLAKTKNVGHHLWYPEGANKLIEVQADDGGWGNHVGTCFALLFLKRATFIVTGESYQERAKKKDGEKK